MVSGLSVLRKQVTVLLNVATKYDEVVCVLSSYGGAVHSYGLAAAQLARIRDAGITLTVCVDTVAASGGYMMACVGSKIVAAPHSFVGSIGVVSYRPNFQKLLQRANVDMYLLTSGKYKRTIDVFGEVDEEGKKKAQEELTAIHEAFKDHIKKYRPQLDMEAVGTGEAWMAVESLSKDLGLVDELMTSDEYLMRKCSDFDVVRLKRRKKRGMEAVLGNMASQVSCWWQSWFDRVRGGQEPLAQGGLDKLHVV